MALSNGRSLIRRSMDIRHKIFCWILRLAYSPSSKAPPIPNLINRILVVRLDELGDWLLTSAFLRELRRLCPSAHITVVANKSVTLLAVTCPYIDEFLPYELRRAPPPFDQLTAWIRARSFARTKLSGRHFDLTLIPRWDVDDGAAVALAFHVDAPIRIGYGAATYTLKAIKNAGYDRLLTHVVPSGNHPHEVERTLDVLRFLGADIKDTRLEAWLTREDEAYALTLIDTAFPDVGVSPLIAIAPGAAIDRRRWPASRYGSVAARLIRDPGARIVILGGPGDVNLAAALVAEAGGGVNIVNLAGKLTLRQSLAVLGHCKLFIGNDSGPAQMATSMGVPIIWISCHPDGGAPLHSNAPERFAPWDVPKYILRPRFPIGRCTDHCASDHAHCILDVATDMVSLAAVKLLDMT